MSRGIFKKQNGQWKRVIAPSYNDHGTWKSIQKGFVKKNGIWQQFFPSDVIANILVVGGGGGGGIGYGYEGGGGGGAGGVVYNEGIKLSVLSGNHYTITVGTGGSENASGGYSSFGDGGIVNLNTSSVPVYAGTYPVYNGFLNAYGVWTSPDFVNPVDSLQQVVYSTIIDTGGRFTVRASADNEIEVFVNGTSIVSNSDWSTYNDGIVDLSAGSVTITVNAINRDAGSPGLFSAALYDAAGNLVWNTRSPLTNPTRISGFTALGGGNGGWGTPEQTAGNGASGGGGCGYVNTHDGAAGYPGQGNNGGTGIWQGYGAAGGGGGGGFAGAGAGSNGNQGGAGGPGINLLGFEVGGGGGGGYGNQGRNGTGPGGAGGAGGGGDGNGGNGVPGTGGGGGGSLHSAATSAGRGGSGLVVVQYPGSPSFNGGEIRYDNGVTTHVFYSSSALSAQ
jgi:hypothetical protein